MDVTQTPINDKTVKLKAVASAEEVDQALQQCYADFARQTGLQPEEGKTIPELAKEKFGIDDLEDRASQQAIEWLVPYALDDQDITPAFAPTPQIKTPFKPGKEFSFEVNVTLKPEYELSSYDPVTITVPPFEIDEAAVDQQIEQIAESYARYVPADSHPIANGDTCKIEMECTENGEKIEALCSKSRVYVVGEGYMPESFDKGIIGAEPGDTKTFTFQAPSYDDNGEEVEQDVDCTVTILELQERVLPTINDEWVAENMPFYSDAASLRKSISDQMEEKGRQEYEDFKLSAAAGALVDRFEGHIDDVVYEEMRKNYLADMQQQMQVQGVDYNEFVEQQGGEEQFGMMLMMQIRQGLVQGYALDAVFRHENLTVSDEDIMTACESMNPGTDPAQTRKQLEENGRNFVLREGAQRACANKWVLDHATVNVAQQ